MVEDDVIITDIQDPEQVRVECPELQKAVWGYSDFRECYPPQLYLIQSKIGGSAKIALYKGKVVGFALALAAWDPEKKKYYQFSQILGIDRTFRNKGVGFKLKLAQREHALLSGVDEIRWTFDPLEGGNTSLNVSNLGGIAREYLEDPYRGALNPGERNEGDIADRFQLEWWIRSKRVESILQSRSHTCAPQAYRTNPKELIESGKAVVVNRVDRMGDYQVCSDQIDLAVETPYAIVQIPGDLQTVKQQGKFDVLLDWRRKTRRIFQHYFDNGYVLVDFHSTVVEKYEKRRENLGVLYRVGDLQKYLNM